MNALSPSSLVAAAGAFVGLQELAGGLIPDSVSELVRRNARARGIGRWDLALLHHWGFWSQFDHAASVSAWPLIPTAEPDELAVYAHERGVLAESPLVGDVFLQASTRRGSFVRGGVVAHINGGGLPNAAYYDILSLEGSSSRLGELNGPFAARVVRRLAPENGDRFVRWTAITTPHVLATEESVGDAANAVERTWALFRPKLRRFARRLTDDRALRADMLQEAMIALWTIDPTRFDLHDEADVQYLRKALRNRMRDVYRAEMLRCASTAPPPAGLSVGGFPFGPTLNRIASEG